MDRLFDWFHKGYVNQLSNWEIHCFFLKSSPHVLIIWSCCILILSENGGKKNVPSKYLQYIKNTSIHKVLLYWLHHVM